MADGDDGPPKALAEVAKDTAMATLKAAAVTFALFLLNMIVMLAGVFVFQWIEGTIETAQLQQNVQYSQNMALWQQQLAVDLFQQKWAPNYNATVRQLISQLQINITQGIANYAYPGTNVTGMFAKWSFPSAFLFIFEVATTIGNYLSDYGTCKS